MKIFFLFIISFVLINGAKTFSPSLSILTRLIPNQSGHVFEAERIFMVKTLFEVQVLQRNKRGHLWEMIDEFENKDINSKQDDVEKLLTEANFIRTFLNKFWNKLLN